MLEGHKRRTPLDKRVERLDTRQDVESAMSQAERHSRNPIYLLIELDIRDRDAITRYAEGVMPLVERMARQREDRRTCEKISSPRWPPPAIPHSR